jgi:ubiquinone/menaquinone biosynthesis C-methylase UbiE
VKNMKKPTPVIRKAIKAATSGRKPHSWPGGVRVAPQFRMRAGMMRKKRGAGKLSRYQSRTASTYRVVDQAKGPAIYGRTDVYETLHKMGEFQAGQKYHIADFATGVGLVGSKVAGLATQAGAGAHVTFMDVNPKADKIQAAMQKEAPGVPFDIKASDFRRINAADGTFQRAFCRFAIKNMQPDQQNAALREIWRVTSQGGIFVLNDMLSPSGLKDFQNAERRAKNSAGGNPQATHNVPTQKEWIQRLTKAGFKVEDIQFTTSDVHTGDWVNSGQVTENGLRSYYKFLRTAQQRFPGAWKEYKIEWVNHPTKGPGYRIIYPVIYIKCRKP